MNQEVVKKMTSKQRYVRRDKPEILAPAGSLEKLKFAVTYGADAVYIGGQAYGLRSNADNFSFEEMREGSEFAAARGAKVYVATNIYAHNEDIDGIAAYLRSIADAGVTGIIVADPAIIETCQHVAPELEVHLSTQQSTTNWRSVQFWKEQGVHRVVLAREVGFEEIRKIKDQVDIEIEQFVHGAMCSSYSGRCVLSNHFTDRDSNRGGCCQSCRWQYDLFLEEESITPTKDEPFMMSSKDLCMIEHIPDIIEAGIDSLKIEGRMRSIHYVATVVHAYRQAVDRYFENPAEYTFDSQWLVEIEKAANRPLNTGFFFEAPDEEDHIFGPEDKRTPFDFCGVVKRYDVARGMVNIQQRNHFKPGQMIEFFGPTGVKFRQIVEEIFDDEGTKLTAARHPMQSVWFKVDQPVSEYDLVRRQIKQVLKTL